MASESLVDVLRDSTRPVFLLGSTPPREGTSLEKAQETCAKFTARSAVLATDGFIVYDIQDERSRISAERPFPFRKTMDPALYASLFPHLSGKQCVVYKAVSGETEQQFDDWLNRACDANDHHAFVLVGAASSSAHSPDCLTLPEASRRTKQRGGCAFGSVCIPERHSSKGNEHTNMFRKTEHGSEWFITQGIFAVEPAVKLIHDYGDACRAAGVVPKKIILTFAPCGREKTMSFIKWLGMHVPEDVEKRILSAESPVIESVKLLGELLTTILHRTGGSGVPLGVNVESLSIFKEEIDATHNLFQSLQAILLNTKGSPWAVRWFFVKPSSLYVSARASDDALNQKQIFYSGGNLKELSGVKSTTSTSSTSAAVVRQAATPKSAPGSLDGGAPTTVNTCTGSSHITAEASTSESCCTQHGTVVAVAILAALVGFVFGRHHGGSK